MPIILQSYYASPHLACQYPKVIKSGAENCAVKRSATCGGCQPKRAAAWHRISCSAAKKFFAPRPPSTPEYFRSRLRIIQVPIHRRGGSAIIAATIENKASTVRIHDDYCSETALSSLPLSEIISEAYRRRGKSAKAVAGNQPPRSGAEAL